jgi:hypothetical protein
VHDQRGKTFVSQRVKNEEDNEFYFRDGFEFDAMIEEFQIDMDLEELVDIRENSAYIAFVAMIGGYINYDEDGYGILAKEYKKELKYAAGQMMVGQLREMVNKSVHTIRKFFESFSSLAELVEENGEVAKESSVSNLSEISNIHEEPE